MPTSPPPPAPPAGSPTDPERSWHPPVATLTAHLRGELPPDQADRVREHVAGCDDCIELLLDLDAFERPADAAEVAGSSAERSDSWQRLLAQRPWDDPAILSPSERPATSPPASPPSPATRAAEREPARRDRRRPLPWRTPLIAASLAAAALTGLWALHLHRQLTTPDPDHPVIDLVPGGVTRGGDPVVAFEVPRDASFTALIVPDAEGPFEHYQAVLLDAEGDEVWRGTLRPREPADPYPTLSLALSRRLLDQRSYTLRLWGMEGDQRTEAGSYRVEFTE